MRPVIDLQHIFHGSHEGGAGVRRNDELLLQVRFEKVFFSVRPIVLSLALATMFSSTTLSSSRLNVHRARPFGGSEQVSAISLASEAPSKMRGLAEAASACGLAPPRTLPPQAAGGFGLWSPGWHPRRSRSGCRSRLRRPPRHRPSTGCGPSSTFGQGGCRYRSTSPTALALPR